MSVFERWIKRALFSTRTARMGSTRSGMKRKRLSVEALEERLVPAAPHVLSINYLNPATEDTGAASVTYALTFDQAVTGVAASDFKLVLIGGVQAASPVVVNGSGANYTVTVNGILGSGTLELDLVDNDTIINGSGTPLGGIGLYNGSFLSQTYTIQQADPFIVSINRDTPAGPATNDGTVAFTVTFNKAVTGVGPSNFTVVDTGTVETELTQVTPVSGSVYTVTVSGITGNGTLGLNFADNGAIHDLNGRPMASSSVSFQPQQTVGTGLGARSPVLADLNGDGKADMVEANYNDGTISVLLGNGNGTFQAQQTYAVGTAPRQLVLDDVNGDGVPDLLVANAGDNTVGVLMGNGNGTFQAMVTYATGGHPRSLAVGDLNGDGKPDLAVGNYGDDTISVFLNNGDGTFQAQQTYASGANIGTTAVADLNGDGKPDLLVANYHANTVSVLLGNGNGTFQSLQTYGTALTPQSIAVGDLNGDGKPDLVLASYLGQAVSVLLGNGDGSFQAQTSYAVGTLPYNAVLADINGDGKLDIAAVNYKDSTVSVLLGNGDGSFQAQSTFAAGTTPWSIGATDLNGDGKADVVVGSYGPPSASILLANGNGNFIGKSQIYTIDQIPPYVESINRTTPAGPETNATSVTYTVTFSEAVMGVAASDFTEALNGVTANAPVVTRMSGSVYTVTIDGIAGAGSLGLNLVDDGAIHDLAGNPLATPNASVSFASQTSFAVGAGTRAEALGVLTGNGKTDLVFANANANSVSVLLGNGNGTFQAAHTYAVGVEPYSVALADVNGDGKLDLVTANFGANTVSVLLGNGNGTFQAQQTFATGASPFSVAVADVNADAKPGT